MKEDIKKILSVIFEDFNDDDFAELKTIVESFKENEEAQKNVINKEQIIRITLEMKEKYPSLEKYSEIVITGQKMDWWNADKYAYNNDALIPYRDEMKDIWKIISPNEYGCAWTREAYSSYSYDAYCVDSDGDIYTCDKHDFCNFFCVR